jgi:phage shock protein C
MTLSDDLHKLDELRARGALTDEEFARAKERLLNAGSTNPAPSAAAAPTAGSPACAAASGG